MIAQLYEKLRGIDQWPEVVATAVSAPMQRLSDRNGRPADWSSTIKLAWTDHHGNPRTGVISARDDSPLFQLYQGSRITIRYNPKSPSSFHIRTGFEHRVRQVRIVLILLLIWIALGFLRGLLILQGSPASR